MKPQSYLPARIFRVFLLTVLPVALSAHTVLGAGENEGYAEPESAINWHTFDEAQSKATVESRPLFIFVEAEWCISCKRMKSEVFPIKEVNRILNERYYAVSIDVDSREKLNFFGESLSEREFVRKKKVATTPTMIFLKPDGTELGRRPGALDSDGLVTLLKYVDSEYFGKLSLEEFEKKSN